MRGLYYSIEAWADVSHLEDRMKTEQNEHTLRSVQAMGVFAVGVSASLAAYALPGSYEANRDALQAVIENNSLALSLVGGAVVFGETLLATVALSAVAEFGSLTRQAHRRLKELHNRQPSGYLADE